MIIVMSGCSEEDILQIKIHQLKSFSETKEKNELVISDSEGSIQESESCQAFQIWPTLTTKSYLEIMRTLFPLAARKTRNHYETERYSYYLQPF
ncbi:hypothetical protein BSG1_04110 [Bacillus sp. SG-1]|nr:hypothetical protein BSG1_04110 [Bacillus sp. SG-1]